MNNKDFYQKFGVWVSSNVRAWPEILRKKDWLRSARQAQGIKGLELADKLGISAARVSMIERDEEKGSLTLNSLERAAHALVCELVYMLIPKQSMRQTTGPSENKPRIKILPESSLS